MSSPNTLGIYNEMSTLMTAAKLSDGTTPAYTNVFLGGVPDYTGLNPSCVITARAGSSKRLTFGGKIIDHIELEVKSVVDWSFQTAQTQELALIAIRDAVIPIFEQHANLNGVTGVYNSALKPNSEIYNWMMVNGNWYRTHKVTVVVAQEYTLVTGITA